MNVKNSTSLLLLAILLVSIAGPVYAQDCSDPILYGYRDFFFKKGGVSSEPTEFDPESKLWWHDGSWWSILWDPDARTHRIFNYDFANHCWSDEGTDVDERPRSSADVLSDGAKLYVASHARMTHKDEHGPEDARLYRFSYDGGTRKYSLDTGFPVVIHPARSSALTIAKDSSGQLWATWDGTDQKVYVNRTLGDDLTWGTPFVVPGFSDLGDTDFTSSIVAFAGSRIGVLWSNPEEQIIYFSIHLDASSDTQWQTREVALSEPGKPAADNHINLVAHPNGMVFAAVKTRFFSGNDPVIYLLKRTLGGTWSRHVFGTRSEKHNRPMVLVDSEHDSVYVFAKNDNGWPRGIYMKGTSIHSPEFTPGIGTPFILSESDSIINNPTSTKQALNSETGLLVLAGSKKTSHYVHNYLDLSGLAPQISSFFPTSGPAGTEVTLTGENFTGTTQVRFGTLAAGSFAVDSDTQLRAVFPVDGRTSKITVHNARGSGISQDAFQTENDALEITAPNGGEDWPQNSNQAILWHTTGTIANVTLEYSIDGGATWSIIVASTPNDGSYNWVVPTIVAENCLIRVSDAGDNDPRDISDAPFSISPSTLPVGEMEIIINADDQFELWVNGLLLGSDNQWNVAQKYTAPVYPGRNLLAVRTFNIDGPGALITQVSVDSNVVLRSDSTWSHFDNEQPGWTGFAFADTSWIPAIDHGQYGAEPWYHNINNFPDTSTASWISGPDLRNNGRQYFFRGSFDVDGADPLSPPQITGFEPDSAEVGSEITILGTDFLGITSVTFHGIPAAGFVVDSETQIRAVVPESATTGQIAVEGLVGTGISTTDFTVLIDPTLLLTSILGGETLLSGEIHGMTWQSQGAIISVQLDYSLNDGVDWNPITATTPNDGGFDWLVPLADSDAARLRVSDALNPAVFTISEAFSILSTEVQTFFSEPTTVGYKDFVFGDGVNDTPTAEKPESKLWWNDGSWWGILWNPISNAYRIHQFSLAQQAWTNTGPDVDVRGTTLADALWDGFRLYVLSHPMTASGGVSQIYRYSYDPGSQSYSLDPGFPTHVGQDGAEAMTLAKDSSGQLWVTWEGGGKIWVNRSLGDDSAWGSPFVLPVQGSDVKSDDISAILAFGGNRIGILWSNQNDQAAYFAIHYDHKGDEDWEPREAALKDASLGNVMDDHVNLKADRLGNIFAVTKTVLLQEQMPNLFFLKRNTSGSWSRSVVSVESEEMTRPILLLDEENREGYVFAKNFKGSPEAIYMKKTSLDDVGFSPGLGTPFIQNNKDKRVNNPTSTKQNVNSTTGILVLAAHSSKTTYYHNYMTLASGGHGGDAPVITAISPGSGPIGSEVLLTGQYFVEPLTIYFNGIAAGDFVVESDSLIRATVPLGATTGDIAVTNAFGTGFSATPFTVVKVASDKMVITINADDMFELWVNGEFVGSNDEWDQAQTYTVQVRPGKNALAIRGTNMGFPGAVIAEVRMDDEVVFATDGTWRRHGSEVAGWTGIDFDDSGWSSAVAHGQYGSSPWNTSINNFPVNSPAQWIWGEVLREEYRQWYLRGSFSAGAPLPAPEITALTPVSGFVGDEVLISGSNFDNASDVLFSGTPATSFVVDSSSAIRAVVPAGAASGQVSVTTPGGTAFSPLNFTVSLRPHVQLTSPNGGEQWLKSTTQRVSWNHQGVVGPVKLEYTLDNGANWHTMTDSTDNDGRFDWILPDTEAANGLVRIADLGTGAITDSSDAFFSIIDNDVTLTTSVTGSGDVQLDPTGDTFPLGTQVGVTATPADGWKFSGWQGALTGLSNPDTVTMDGNKQITAVFTEIGTGKLTLTQPNGGESWHTSTVRMIKWTSEGPITGVKLAYSMDQGANWTAIDGVHDNDGIFEWQLPDGASSQSLVQIVDKDDAAVADTSDNVFSIVVPPPVDLGEMDITINADDIFELWVNGEFVGSDDQWNEAQHYKVPVRAGKNVLAIKGTNLGFPGAVIAEVRIDGEVVLVTDGGWRRTGSEVSGWRDINYDDSGWLSAIDHGVYGSSPWGKSINNLPENSPAHWIWGEVLREPYREWYLRGHFDRGTPEPAPEIVTLQPDSGFVGAEVTILGNHFNEVSSVTFDGKATEFIVDSPNQIRTTVPAGAGSGDVQVKAAGGTATSPSPFRVLVPASLTLDKPDGGESWFQNTTESIRWQSTGAVGPLTIELSLDGGTTWSEIIAGTADDGKYNWSIPEVESDQSLIRIFDPTQSDVADTSAGQFSIGPKPVAPLSDMEIVINCDDEYELWVNGQFIGRNDVWDEAKTFVVPQQAGRNVLAVHGINHGFPGALIAEVRIDGQVVLVTDGTWQRWGSEEPQWTDTNFDDSGWLSAVDHGQYGVSPWQKSINDFPSNSPAHWIWGEVLREPYREWYFRGSFVSAPAKVGIAAETVDPLSEISVDVPEAYELGQNYPNPFNPSTTISYALPEPGAVSIKIFDITGREIRTLVDQNMPQGRQAVVWDGTDANRGKVPAGVYFYRIISGTFVKTKKMILLP